MLLTFPFPNAPWVFCLLRSSSVCRGAYQSSSSSSSFSSHLRVMSFCFLFYHSFWFTFLCKIDFSFVYVLLAGLFLLSSLLLFYSFPGSYLFILFSMVCYYLSYFYALLLRDCYAYWYFFFERRDTEVSGGGGGGTLAFFRIQLLITYYYPHSMADGHFHFCLGLSFPTTLHYFIANTPTAIDLPI